MPDNVGYTPGSGAKVAAREVNYSGETAFSQSVSLVTVTGPDDGKIASDVTSANPLPVDASAGELIEAIEALRVAVASLTKTIGFALPNALGQPIMEVRQPTAANLNVTLSATTISSGTLTTLTTLTNQQQAGGFALQDQIPATMHMQYDGLRANIQVT